MSFKRMKTLFFSKNTLHIFSSFFKFKNFLIFTDFQKKSFFLEKTCFFERANLGRIWEILQYQSHSTATLLWFGDKKISKFRIVRTFCPDNWPSNFLKTHHFEWMIFLQYYKHGQKIINLLTFLELSHLLWLLKMWNFSCNGQSFVEG